MKRIVTGDEAKEQLLEGAKLLYDAVSSTLSPKGQNAVIEAFGEPIVTHDGVTVAKAIDSVVDCSPGARVGIEMIKASSSRTNDNVGDGTTTSTILTYHLMADGMEMIKNGKNAMVLRRELDEATQQVLGYLEEIAEPIKTEKSTIEVATISSEDPVIGKEVGHMYHTLGKNAMVAVEIGTKPDTEFEIVEGYTFERGLFDQSMITDTRTQTATIENTPILLAHQTIGVQDIALLCENLYNEGKDGLVIIADEIKPDVIDLSIKQRGMFEITCIKAPGFGDQRVELFKDLAKLLNATVYGKGFVADNSIDPKTLGSCDKIVATMNETIITGGHDVSEHIKDLEAKMELTKGEFDKSKIEKRIGQLHAKVGQIRVGGNTEMEAEERKYLVDDAVAAVEAALKDGIVPGAATTYIELSLRLGEASEGQKLLKDALLAPFKVLMTNAGERWGTKLEQYYKGDFGQGFDVMSPDKLIDLKEHGIIDPVLVIKQAITNATSVAGSALTTGVLITTEKDKDEKEEE
jgi:chaperonin GroEL